MKPALDHHYAVNSHHPEHFRLWRCDVCLRVFQDPPLDGRCPHCREDDVNGEVVFERPLTPHVGVEGMTILDVMEMLADWKAASERHATGDIRKSIEINASRFKIGDQMKAILLNTLKEMGW